MILLETTNRAVASAVRNIILPDPDYPSQAYDTSICEFDNATFLVDCKNNFTVSLALPCYGQIKEHGAREAIEQAFGSMLSTPRDGYDITLLITPEHYQGKEEETIQKIASMKTIALGGVFEKYYKALHTKNIDSLSNFKFNIRPDTTVYLVPHGDRIYTTFRLSFQDKADIEIAKVFLSEFADPAQRRKVQRAPLVSFDVAPPTHLKSFGVTTDKNDVGYVSFTLLDMHVVDGTRTKAVDCMQSFRNFVQYHIKCAKSYFHSRMRLRVSELLKVLNRAKTVPDKNQPKRITNAAGKVLIR